MDEKIEYNVGVTVKGIGDGMLISIDKGVGKVEIGGVYYYYPLSDITFRSTETLDWSEIRFLKHDKYGLSDYKDRMWRLNSEGAYVPIQESYSIPMFENFNPKHELTRFELASIMTMFNVNQAEFSESDITDMMLFVGQGLYDQMLIDKGYNFRPMEATDDDYVFDYMVNFVGKLPLA